MTGHVPRDESQQHVRLARGACVISIDTELAWGSAHHRTSGRPAHRFDLEREIIGRILDLFAEHGIPATWAVVGHLFLDRCAAGPGGVPHPELARPAYPWLDGDWFAVDPCTDLATDPDYYGRDIVDRIRACPVPQEIGSHSFSHVIAGEPGCGGDVLASELDASQAAAVGLGLSLKSFVYPRNAVAHVDRLAGAGFTSYRGARPTRPFAGTGGWRRRGLATIDRFRPLPGSAVWPVREEAGVVNVPQTYFFAPEATGRALPVAAWARFPIGRIRQAARQRSLFHLWFHPYNVTAAPGRALAALDRICRAVARERDRGRLDTLTMTQVADLVEGAEA